MKLTKTQFKEDFERRLREKFALDIEDSSSHEYFYALGSLVRAYYSKEWQHTIKTYDQKQVKQAYYFSIEFLPGRMLQSNLLNLGILDTVKAGLKDLGLNLEDICRAEPDMALGNGGLGRLASCFMDSAASCALPLNGNGVRYNYGLFKQKFVDGYQVELPETWLKDGNVWEVRKENRSVLVGYGGSVALQADYEGTLRPVYYDQEVIKAVPYDMAMVGFENNTCNNLRLWKAEIPDNAENNYLTAKERERVDEITAVLYPDDSNYEGRLLRLKQEYFFVSAGIQSIVAHYKTLGLPFRLLPKKIAIHINDTHPALCVPELMRLLLDDAGMTWEDAWEITINTMSYTNHTIMAEAFEKWPVSMVETLLPRIYQIIQEIDRRFVEEMTARFGYDLVKRTQIIQDGHVQMAYLAIIGSHSVNGVAELHSDLLKDKVLHDFYVIYPERFNNKTNGITERRWLQLANQPLSKVLDEAIGKSWRKNPDDLRKLKKYANDDAVLNKLAAAKLANKQRLAGYILEVTGIKADTDAIFDVQIKRLHAYKRQLLNLLHILKLYFDLKDDPTLQIQPRVFIFGAKAAPSYRYAKSIIKCINAVAALINRDETIKDQLKIVFLENYNVSLAEIIIPAADVSEQISLAGKEASGTSNMKLMLNGAITIATLDGANVAIQESVGDDNIFIFGMTEQEVYRYYHEKNYSSAKIYEENPVVKRILDAFVDGTIAGIEKEGREVFDSLVTYNDEYFVLRDFDAYCEAQIKLATAYKDQKHWLQMSLQNIANAGRFSADDTIRRYAKDIWHIEPTAIK